MIRVNDLIPSVSGGSHLGVDGGAIGVFDESTITPFGHIHQISGVWHDPLYGTSGVIRFNQVEGCFEVSVDGGISFNCVATAGGTVTSVGVLGDANLSGDVDFASPGSGFVVIEDSSDASPLLWSVNTLGLSGLWGFPTGGFPTQIPGCYAETFSASTTWTVTHNLNSTDVSVTIFDDSSPRMVILPDTISTTNSNTVTITFNRAQAGRVVIFECPA